MVKKVHKKLNISPAQELEILRRIVEITNSSLDLKSTLDEVVKALNEMTRADSIFIYLFDENRTQLTLMASKTPHKKELGKVSPVGSPARTKRSPSSKARIKTRVLNISTFCPRTNMRPFCRFPSFTR